MQRILVAVDGSEASANAAKYAISLCEVLGTQLDALSIIDMPSNALNANDDSPAAISVRQAEALLGQVEKWAKSAMVPCKTALEYGDTKEILLQYSDTHDLTILGATGASSASTDLGSTAQWLTKNAIRPVCVTRPPLQPLQKVLIGYNRSSAAASALQCVAELANNAEIEVTVVVGANTQGEGEVLIQQAQAYLKGYGISAQPHIVIPEDGTNALLHASDALSPDLIVLGSRGANSIAQLLLGSTSQSVLEQANCSVLIVH